MTTVWISKYNPYVTYITSKDGTSAYFLSGKASKCSNLYNRVRYSVTFDLFLWEE